MAIRLNKILKELNIGIDSAIEALIENGVPESIASSLDINSKLSEEQSSILRKVFRYDQLEKIVVDYHIEKRKSNEAYSINSIKRELSPIFEEFSELTRQREYERYLHEEEERRIEEERQREREEMIQLQKQKERELKRIEKEKEEALRRQEVYHLQKVKERKEREEQERFEQEEANRILKQAQDEEWAKEKDPYIQLQIRLKQYQRDFQTRQIENMVLENSRSLSD